MKILAELRDEIELGFSVFASDYPGVEVFMLPEIVGFNEGEGKCILGEKHYILLPYHYDDAGSYTLENEMPDRLVDENSVDFYVSSSQTVGCLPKDCFLSFDDLLAYWPKLTAQSIWSTLAHPKYAGMSLSSMIATRQ